MNMDFILRVVLERLSFAFHQSARVVGNTAFIKSNVDEGASG